MAIYNFLKLYRGIIHIPGFTLFLGFKIDGFEIDVADDASIQFVVICYDAEEKFIGTVNGQGDMSEEKMTELGFNENTVYFRVVINPAPVDGEPVELNLFNKAKYADQLTITYKK